MRRCHVRNDRKTDSPNREAKSIKCDAYGNVYICGLYKNGCKFGSQTLYAPQTYFNSFLAKYNSNGDLLWVKTAGGDWDDVGWSMTIDGGGKIYVTGEFNATVNFGGHTIWTTGSSDVFVACYDANGNVLWVRKAGGSKEDRARGIASAGNRIYITGQFGQKAYFGPHTRTAADNSDIFMACLDNAGNFLWVSTVGGGADAPEDLGYESGNAICAQTNGNVYATGSTLNGGQFGGTYLSAWTRTDVFVTKLISGTAPVSYTHLTLPTIYSV